jgi:pyridoxal phosphate enzyme (YggS family)
MKDLKEFRERFEAAVNKAGRAPGAVRLLGVSKGQSIEKIESFLAAGLPFWALGESYLEELVAKQTHFAARPLPWHFIGRLQSRKIPALLEKCEVLHTVTRSKELDLFPEIARDFFIQVNVSDEDSKNGCSPLALPELLADVERRGLRRHCLGLMTLPSPVEDIGEARLRGQFGLLRELRDEHLPGGLLNMGTSGDFEIAIAEGADVVRVGSLLFGERS